MQPRRAAGQPSAAPGRRSGESSGEEADPGLDASGDPGESLRLGARRLGVEIDEVQVRDLLAHLDELRLWAPRLSLVSAADLADPNALVERHVLDSIAAVPVVAAAGCRILDLGSGAGFPGIPVAVALRSPRSLLVEPRRKRANFLRAVARRLPGVGIAVAGVRIEDLSPAEIGPGFDAVLSRAALPLEDLRNCALRCLVPGGRLVAFRGPGQPVGEEAEVPGLRRLPDHAYRVGAKAPELRLAAWERVEATVGR